MFSEIESTYDTTGKKDQPFLGCGVRFSQTFPFVAGGGRGMGFAFCVYDTFYDVQTRLLESGFEFIVCCL